MADASTPSNPNLHSSHHTGKRLRQLLHPNGRRIHIAGSPDEHERLKLQLVTSEPDQDFDVCVHGSPEHLAAVREIHSHQEQKREELRQQFPDQYNTFEDVHRQLDLLSNELQSLTSHGVFLNASFSRFGYDAHLRTREPDSSASSTTVGNPADLEERDWDAERQKGTALRFWRPPIVRQYFHRGLLWRAEATEEVASFELFVDLLYVGIIAIIGDTAAENATSFGFLQFLVTFVLSWKMWNDLTLTISWFETDDITQRIAVLFVMICLFGYTLNIVAAFDSTWTQLVAFYLTQRLFNCVYYLQIAYLLPMVRGSMVYYATAILVPSALWIGSVQLGYPERLALVWVAIPLDLFGPLFMIIFTRLSWRRFPNFKDKLNQWFDFFPAINIEHKTERTNAFVTLVFGYSVVALLYQNKAAFGINAFFGKAILGLIQAFSFNWIYFEIDACNIHTHAIRRHVVSSLVWITVHLPFIMSFVLAGSSLSRLVLVHDCVNADPETLGEDYITRSEPEVSVGSRWFYCGGLGTALICMAAISLSHVHKKIENQRINKRPRLALRVAVGIVLICLPLAESLTSLQLIFTTTGLVVLTLMFEVGGSTSKNNSFWRDKQRCKYSAECRIRKKAVEAALKAGVTIDVTEIVKDGGDEKRLYEQI
ncbi:MAG: hypothetical protein Q9191_002993 [Dirinaria sp. TL-2023a]